MNAARPVSGHHWLLDLSDCACPRELLALADDLGPRMCELAVQAGMTVVGSCFHQFSPEGVTGAVLLAESHLAVHTWPEKRFVAPDVYVCAHNANNLRRGQALSALLVALFDSRRFDQREVTRGSAPPPARENS